MRSKSKSEGICSTEGIISSSSTKCLTSKEFYEESSDEDHHEKSSNKYLLGFLQHSQIAETLEKLPLDEVRLSLSLSR